MSNRNMEHPLTLGKRRVLLAFVIVPNGTSAPTVAEDYGGAVKSVARTGAGTYTITLNDRYQALLHASFEFQLASAVATLGQVTGAVDVKSAKTISFTVMQESAGTFAAADIAANAANNIYVKLTMRDSTVGTT